MRDKLIILLAVLFIAGCALLTASRINSSYSPADYPDPSPLPLVPTASNTASSTASSTAAAAAPASTAARPRRTVTTWVTVTAPASGEDGP